MLIATLYLGNGCTALQCCAHLGCPVVPVVIVRLNLVLLVPIARFMRIINITNPAVVTSSTATSTIAVANAAAAATAAAAASATATTAAAAFAASAAAAAAANDHRSFTHSLLDSLAHASVVCTSRLKLFC